MYDVLAVWRSKHGGGKAVIDSLSTSMLVPSKPVTMTACLSMEALKNQGVSVSQISQAQSGCRYDNNFSDDQSVRVTSNDLSQWQSNCQCDNLSQWSGRGVTTFSVVRQSVWQPSSFKLEVCIVLCSLAGFTTNPRYALILISVHIKCYILTWMAVSWHLYNLHRIFSFDQIAEIVFNGACLIGSNYIFYQWFNQQNAVQN